MAEIQDDLETTAGTSASGDGRWSFWRDPMTWVVAAAGIGLTVLTILG